MNTRFFTSEMYDASYMILSMFSEDNMYCKRKNTYPIKILCTVVNYIFFKSLLNIIGENRLVDNTAYY